MKDWNTCFAYLNMELPDDIRRLKEAGYYNAAIARIDACLAEDWTASQNQPLHPQGALPVNPTPHGVDAWRQGLLAHREILRRLPQDYTLTAEQLLNRLQATLRDFTTEEFAALDAAGHHADLLHRQPRRHRDQHKGAALGAGFQHRGQLVQHIGHHLGLYTQKDKVADAGNLLIGAAGAAQLGGQRL